MKLNLWWEKVPLIPKNLFNFLKPVRQQSLQLDPESLKEHHLVNALANENTELKTHIAKLESSIAKERETEKDMEEESKVKEYLTKEKKNLTEKSLGDMFSWKKFFALYFGIDLRKHRQTHFADNLYVSSFDKSTKLAKFGDIGFTKKGNFVLLDTKKRPIIFGNNPSDIIHNPGALQHDLKSGLIPVNMDSEGDQFENVLKWEAPEIIEEEEGFRYAKARKKPLYEFLAKYRAEISQKTSLLEEAEELTVKLQNRINELERNLKTATTQANVAQKDLSSKELLISNITSRFDNLARELTKHRDNSVIAEENIASLTKEIEVMRKQAERENVKISDRRALELISDIRNDLIGSMMVVPPIKQEEVKSGQSSSG